MPVFHISPAEKTPARVLIVIQEAFGVNDHIRDVCRRFALEGYEVFAPELFHREGNHLEFEYTDRRKPIELIKQLREEEVVADLNSLVDHINSSNGRSTSDISIVGFCIGGYLSVLGAIRFRVRTAVSFYGAGLVREREGFTLKPLLSRFSQLKSPVLFFFGEEDSSIPAFDRQAIGLKLDELQAPSQIEIFPNADHGFFCDQRSSYHRPSAQQAWQKTLRWLDQCYSMADRSRVVDSGSWTSDRPSP
jgi:carboxymethylenebutenolidase